MESATRDAGRLETIIKMIDDLHRRLHGMAYGTFVDNGDERDLTAYRLSVIGENANKLSDEIKARHPHPPWREM